VPETVVKVADVFVPKGRMRVANHVEELAGSIARNGLLHPITLRRHEGRLILLAGKRRLDAVKLLRWDEVAARVLDVGEVEALLVEIDENLQRAERTALERAQHLAERKRVWLARYPETGHGKAPGAGRGKKKRKPPKQERSSSLGDGSAPALSFADDTAGKTGETARNVLKYTEVGEKLSREAQELLKGTQVENKVTELKKIANLAPGEQAAVAQKLHDGKAKSVHLALRLLKGEAIRREPRPLPDGPFRVIVADPPWEYHKRLNDASKRENFDYPTMAVEEIKRLGEVIKARAAEDAILWLWTTNAHLPEAFAVARAWGFVHKTVLTWDKERLGMGEWLRGQTEHCIFCVRGRPVVELKEQSTLIREARGQHSSKPEAFYRLVESLCPGSKLELFARRKRSGWSSWGSDIGAETSGVRA
jgi:N6-adenosine-specific RNA methylase IME4